ncbi:amidohydrolase family protein [Streptomyces rhizosphaericus]|uniref:amidohydrolase family protein n=3 Tax=Streptomyces rhizosphaericus TaxID=114699 RepID=UPI001BACBD23|nr:amidohydrolase family protein [Streptomyces indonesiensis]
MSHDPRPTDEDTSEEDVSGTGTAESRTERAEATTASKGSTRRTLLKKVGLGAVLIGSGAFGREAVARAMAPDVPARTLGSDAVDMRVDNVTMVDPLDGSRTSGRSIVLRNGHIASVFSSRDAPAETSMRVIDGAGRYAVPGYNEMHTHALQKADTRLAYATMLAQGVTGMRQMQGSEEMLTYRAEQRLGLTEHAPRPLGIPGGLLLPFNAGSVDDVREEIARQWDQGADFIKMILTERDVFFAAIEAAHKRGMRIAGHLPPAIRIEEASERGFDSIEHLGTGSNVFLSLSATPDRLWEQQDTELPIPGWVAGLPGAGKVFDRFFKEKLISSVGRAEPDDPSVVLLKKALSTYSEERATELGDMLARNRTWQCPTLANLRSKYRLDDPEFRSDPWLKKMPAEERKKKLADIDTYEALHPEVRDINHQYYDRVIQTIGIWSKAGAPLMAGTDTSGRAVANTIQHEFRELARAGLTPLEVLRTATTAPATYLGLAHRMGRVAEDMEADFLLLDADPLDSVDNLGAISMVVRAGHAFTSEDLTATVDKLLAEGEKKND